MRVLFLCTLNAVRSPMAAAMATKFWPENEYESAGVNAGPVDYLAIEVMQEIGIDIAQHEPKPLEDLAGEEFDLVIGLANETADDIHYFATQGIATELWDIPSPGEVKGNRNMRVLGYRDIREKIEEKLRRKFIASRKLL